MRSNITYWLSAILLLCLLNACSGQQEAINGARKLLQEKKFKEAEAACTKLIDTEPQNAEAWYLRGYSRLQQGALSACVTDFDRAIQLAPESKSTNDSLGLYYFERGLANYLNSQYPPALSDFQKAVDLKHDPGNALTYLGITQGALGDDITAIQTLDKAVKAAPESHFAWSNRGYYNSKLGDNRTAIADFTKAISLQPDDKASYLNRGYTYIGMGDYATAILDFQKALDIDPNFTGALAYMGIALTNTGRPAEAVGYLDQAIKIDPGNPTLYYYRGAARINSDDLAGGCADLQHALDNGDNQGVPMMQQFCNK
jgi:tetratricopeptide (TPR) repeat protein